MTSSAKQTPKRNANATSTYKPTGPATLKGSTEAKRLAAVILEVLAGLCGPAAAAKAVGISLPRYYLLETRALQGLIASLEPMPRGRQRTPADEIADLKSEKKKLERELMRLQALLRAAQRSIGIKSTVEKKTAKSTTKTKGGAKARKKPRPQVRANKAIAALRKPDDAEKKPVEAPKAAAAPLKSLNASLA